MKPEKTLRELTKILGPDPVGAAKKLVEEIEALEREEQKLLEFARRNGIEIERADALD